MSQVGSDDEEMPTTTTSTSGLSKETCLDKAARSNDVDTVKSLIEADVSLVNHPMTVGWVAEWMGIVAAVSHSTFHHLPTHRDCRHNRVLRREPRR